ncbi:MAG: hypothetical protein WCK75_02230 [Elusimicrobiota bacterium]
MKRKIIALIAAFIIQPLLCGASWSAASETGRQIFEGGTFTLDRVDPPATPATPLNNADGLLFPEDGSMPMAAWYTDLEQAVSPGLVSALAAEGVELRGIKFRYDWIQDIAVFSRGGAIILQAEMPVRILKDLGLTMGVFDFDDNLTAVSEHTAESIGSTSRRMKWTFLEGGGLITGSFRDGRPYAIITPSPVEGARNLYLEKTRIAISSADAKVLVAKDLEVDEDDLFIIPAFRHIDLFIAPLRGGELLLSDPSKTAGVLKQLLAGSLQDREREQLAGMLELYQNGFQPVYSGSAPPDIAGKPMGDRLFAYDKSETAMLDAVERELSGRFKIVRTAGVFKNLERYINSAESLYIRDGINFFNGFTGSGRSGKLFQITNGAAGLTALENYWRSVLVAQGVAPERVYFPGSYSQGAGLDCRGAPAGQ